MEWIERQRLIVAALQDELDKLSRSYSRRHPRFVDVESQLLRARDDLACRLEAAAESDNVLRAVAEKERERLRVIHRKSGFDWIGHPDGTWELPGGAPQ